MSGTGDLGSSSDATRGGGPDDPAGPGGPYDPERSDPAPDGNRSALIAVAAVLAVVVVVLLVLLFTRDDGDEDVDTAGSTSTSVSTTTEATTTTEPSSSTSEATTTTSPGGVTADEASTVIWPDPAGSGLFDDPVAAAEGFAQDLVAFTAPVIGEFQAGDSRSGEVEVRPMADGPVTTVSVRQMSDDNWYVIAANTDQIEVTSPTAGTAIDDPLLVEGRAQAFEGTVQVAVYARESAAQIGEGFVTGSGSEMGPFSGEIAWDNPGGGWGVVLFTSHGGEDGSPWQVTAIPVGFLGDD